VNHIELIIQRGDSQRTTGSIAIVVSERLRRAINIAQRPPRLDRRK